MNFKDIDSKGMKFPVTISDDGNFQTLVDGTQLTAPTLAGLKTKLGQAMSKKSFKTSINFVRWEGGRLKRGKVTGLHASNNNILISWDNGKREQEYGHDTTMFLAMDAKEEKKYSTLQNEQRSLQKKIDALESKHGFNPRFEIGDEMRKFGIDPQE